MSVQSSGIKVGIKRLARRLVARGSDLLRHGVEGRLTPGLRILTYHRVAHDARDPFAVKPPEFERQMEAVSRSSSVQRLEQALDLLPSDESIPRIALTFDDGTEDFLTEALPVLCRFGLPATLYLSPGKIGTGGFLTWENVREVSRSGVVVGSHGLDHRSLGLLDAGEAWRQIHDSKAQLEDYLGLPVRTLAYPFGTPRDFSSRVKEQVQRAGYRAACSSVNGVNHASSDPFELRRTKIEGGDGDIFGKILSGGLDCWALVDLHLTFLQNRYA